MKIWWDIGKRDFLERMRIVLRVQGGVANCDRCNAIDGEWRADG